MTDTIIAKPIRLRKIGRTTKVPSITRIIPKVNEFNSSKGKLNYWFKLNFIVKDNRFTN